MRASTLLIPFLAVLSPCFVSAAQDSFGDWPQGTSPQEIGRRVTERFLVTPHKFLKASNTIHYAEICTWYGALTFTAEAKDKELGAKVVKRFEPLFAEEAAYVPPVTNVDHSVFGSVPLEIYLQTGHPRYRQLGLSFADGQWDRPRADGLTRHTRFWIDDMFMITALQLQAYRATGDRKYLDRTAAEMVVYLDKLQQPNGLFYHQPDTPFFWGRGNGWMAVGMAEILRDLPSTHPHHAVIVAGYQKMMASLLKYQNSDGMWRQLVDRPESWPETSCTGMFAFAFITGVKNGWLDAQTYGPAARKAWLALVGYLTPEGDIRDVCIGTGAKNDYQYYLDRERIVGDYHGQAPVLWCATALLRSQGPSSK